MLQAPKHIFLNFFVEYVYDTWLKYDLIIESSDFIFHSVQMTRHFIHACTVSEKALSFDQRHVQHVNVELNKFYIKLY